MSKRKRGDQEVHGYDSDSDYESSNDEWSDDEATIQQASDEERELLSNSEEDSDAEGYQMFRENLPPVPSKEHMERYFLRQELQRKWELKQPTDLSLLESITPYLLEHILLFLTPEALLCVASVCCSAYILSSHNKIWKSLFPHLPTKTLRLQQIYSSKPWNKEDSHYWWKYEALDEFKHLELSAYDNPHLESYKSAMKENRFLTNCLIFCYNKDASEFVAVTTNSIPKGPVPSPTRYLKKLLLNGVFNMLADDMNYLLDCAESLEELHFYYATKFVGELRPSKPLPKVKSFHFHNFTEYREDTHDPGAIIYWLIQRFCRLRRLSLLDTTMKPSKVFKLTQLLSFVPLLEEFYYNNKYCDHFTTIHRTALSNEDVAAFTQLQHLKVLHLDSCSFHSFDNKKGAKKDILEHLTKCTKLEYLAFRSFYNEIRVDTAQNVVKKLIPKRPLNFPCGLVTNIRELDLDCPITDSLLSSIGAAVPQLERLVLFTKTEPKVSPNALIELVQGCPKIVALEIPETFLLPQFLVVLFGLVKLEELFIRWVFEGNGKLLQPAIAFEGNWLQLRVFKSEVFEDSATKECFLVLAKAFEKLSVLEIYSLKMKNPKVKNREAQDAEEEDDRRVGKEVLYLQEKGNFVNLRRFTFNTFNLNYDPFIGALCEATSVNSLKNSDQRLPIPVHVHTNAAIKLSDENYPRASRDFWQWRAYYLRPGVNFSSFQW